MLMCRQVAKALKEQRYWELPLRKRVGIRVHIALCAMCGKYHTQVVQFEKGIHRFLTEEEKGCIHEDIHLSEEACRSLKQKLHEAETADGSKPV